MRVTMVGVGRLKDGAERVLVDRYLERLRGAKAAGLWPVAEKEISEARQPTAGERKAHEATRLLKAAEGADLVVILDKSGRQFSSEAFAGWLGGARDRGSRHVAFLLGGPDGHGESATAAAGMVLSLGPMTLPHGMARAVLAEQIYRASTILTGHPYHRV